MRGGGGAGSEPTGSARDRCPYARTLIPTYHVSKSEASHLSLPTRLLAALIVVAATLPLPAAAVSEDVCVPGSNLLCAGATTDAEEAEPYNSFAKVHAPGSMAQFQTRSYCVSDSWTGTTNCDTKARGRAGTTGDLPGGTNQARAEARCFRQGTNNSAPLDTCLRADRVTVKAQATEDLVEPEPGWSTDAAALVRGHPDADRVCGEVDVALQATYFLDTCADAPPLFP